MRINVSLQFIIIIIVLIETLDALPRRESNKKHSENEDSEITSILEENKSSCDAETLKKAIQQSLEHQFLENKFYAKGKSNFDDTENEYWGPAKDFTFFFFDNDESRAFSALDRRKKRDTRCMKERMANATEHTNLNKLNKERRKEIYYYTD